jgi:hypothetical protein
MKLHTLVALLALPALPAFAGVIACPDLAAAKQVAACPSEEELKYTFTGFCSDDRRMYGTDTDACTDYALYRKLKNKALWESADGNFSAYVSCDRTPESVKSAKARSVTVSKQKKLSLLVCGYGDELRFTHRTHAECKLDPGAAAACAADPAACKASCE